MTKRELEKIWKQLDGACEAIEKLENNGIEVNIDFTALVSLKNKVEEMIEQKTRSKKS
ncbi:hypothetical protein GCM10010965_14660 [Caldalkalibacillus thermarum]|uniref:hypothetical protein n=1 Tax=Caldalkalibacillus thermarum TaxID=296745 RepID=UPI001663B355|nr:hypothetical protein [Caldalkalibacillus thermarum]GGK22817.1 hypothetical protein GCM10010965_14660 [Caldalkalibacillus thermarum]